jgi:tRNA A37 threonylcarbamoyladenosine dehydratase
MASLSELANVLQTSPAGAFRQEDIASQQYGLQSQALQQAKQEMAPPLAGMAGSMGAGGKTDPSGVMVADINETYNDPFARLVRKRLHKHGIYSGFKSVFNKELVNRNSVKLTDGSNFKRSFYGTISYMPALFGLRIAAEVIEDLR